MDSKYQISDIDDYQNRLSEEQKVSLIKHCNKYNIAPIIIAWYDDWEDFCSDWCDHIGYSRTYARKRLNERTGEFRKFTNGEIVRLNP